MTIHNTIVVVFKKEEVLYLEANDCVGKKTRQGFYYNQKSVK